MSKAKNPQVSNADLRRQLDADVEQFLKSGKKIQQIPTGVSSQDYSKGRKHIVLGKSKQQAELGGNKEAPEAAAQESESKAPAAESKAAAELTQAKPEK
jgi:hypothetical protein